MPCNHQNPIGYLFCATCGQSLDHTTCLCGFVCAAEALYCGRCGHSLTVATVDDLMPVSAIEHRYDLDTLAQLAGVLNNKIPVERETAMPISDSEKARRVTAKKGGGEL